MTILQRLMRAMKPDTKLNAGFENYYSKLLSVSAGDSGLPTASEAQRDLRAALDRQLYYL
jgi:hypothetical protein